MKRYLGLAAIAIAASASAQSPKIGVKPPRLVLLVSIDQFRADYVQRFAPHLLSPRTGGKIGGFRFLTETGVQYLDAHHHHIPTATGPGHSILMTGSVPAINGIIGNDWWDREAGIVHYVTDDATVETVGGKSKPMSPAPLKVTTVGDELKMATNGKSKVVGVAFKDRAAILMAGHAADTVIWFDPSTGNWVTSSFYAPSKKLPTWVDEINKSRQADSALGKSWEPLLPAEAYELSRRAPAEKAAENGKVFSHKIGGSAINKGYFGDFAKSGFGQEFVFKTVERAIDAEKLGQNSVPDILVVNLSTNDYVGHQYGPNSPEVMDITLRTDRLLSELFNTLNKKIPGGIDNVDIVVTADHGVCPIPEESHNVYKTAAGRQPGSLAKPIKAAIVAKFGEGDWVLGDGLYEQNFYLNRKTIEAKGLKAEDVEKVAAEAAMKIPGVYTAFTRTQLLNNQVPQWDWVQMATNGFSPTLGGDLLIFEAPGWQLDTGTGTGHGSPWAYDSHIPIMTRFKGQTPQKVSRTVYTHDIASTLSLRLGIEYPSGNIGKPLTEALPK